MSASRPFYCGDELRLRLVVQQPSCHAEARRGLHHVLVMHTCVKGCRGAFILHYLSFRSIDKARHDAVHRCSISHPIVGRVGSMEGYSEQHTVTRQQVIRRATTQYRVFVMSRLR